MSRRNLALILACGLVLVVVALFLRRPETLGWTLWWNITKAHSSSVVPSSKRAVNPQLYGYAFDSRMHLKKIDDVADPANQPLLCDSDNLVRNVSDPGLNWPKPGRHDGSNRVAFADSHTRSVKPN